MLESPSPTHGFLPVTLAFLGYIVLSFAVTVGLIEAGVPTRLRVPLFIAVSLVLLVPAVRVFRRLTPRIPETD